MMDQLWLMIQLWCTQKEIHFLTQLSHYHKSLLFGMSPLAKMLALSFHHHKVVHDFLVAGKGKDWQTGSIIACEHERTFFGGRDLNGQFYLDSGKYSLTMSCQEVRASLVRTLNKNEKTTFVLHAWDYTRYSWPGEKTLEALKKFVEQHLSTCCDSECISERIKKHFNNAPWSVSLVLLVALISRNATVSLTSTPESQGYTVCRWIIKEGKIQCVT